jgi:hypothetical protein
VWPRTRLPHWGHCVSCGACQRLAAFRVRNRILEVFLLGTPIFKSFVSASIRQEHPTRLRQLPHPELSTRCPEVQGTQFFRPSRT